MSRPPSAPQRVAGQVGSGLFAEVETAMIRPDPSRPAPPRLRAGPWMTAIYDRSLTAHRYDAVELQNSSAVSEARATMPEHVPKFRRFEFINIGTPKHRNVGTLQVRLRFFIVRSADQLYGQG